MEKLAGKHATLLQALKTLEVALDDLKEKEHGSHDYVAFRDSEIKRFEYCYDLLWKYLKLYLELASGIFVQSPRTAFKESFSAGIANESEAEMLLEIITARNTTAHVYRDDFAEQLSKKIPLFYAVMKSVADRTAPSTISSPS